MEEVEGQTGDSEMMLDIPVVTTANGKVVDEELKILFETVIKKIRLSIANGKITPDSFQTILLKVVETIEELSTNQYKNLSGVEKRAIAINITKLVIEDLHDHGQIDEDVYGWMNLGLTFLAPALFSGIKALFTKLQDVGEDINEQGFQGCFYRNCFRKKDLKTKK